MYNFTRKSGSKALRNVSRKYLPALGHILWFSTHFIPIAWVPQCLSHWVLKECLRNPFARSFFVLSLQERQAGRVSDASSHPRSLWTKRNGWKQQKKGKQSYWWGLGGHSWESWECVCTGQCMRRYFTSRLLFEIQVVCNQLWGREQWDHGPSHSASLSTGEAYAIQKQFGKSWVGWKTQSVSDWLIVRRIDSRRNTALWTRWALVLSHTAWIIDSQHHGLVRVGNDLNIVQFQ